MKQLIYYCVGLILICVLYSCDDFGYGLKDWKIWIVNQSDSNVCCAIYGHKTEEAKDDVVCLFPVRGSIAPQDSMDFGYVHQEKDDSWRTIFKKFRIDTMFVAIVRPNVEMKVNAISDLNNNNDVFKVYKFHEDNIDLDLEKTHYTIYYPN